METLVQRIARQRRNESADDRGTCSKRGTLRVPWSRGLLATREKEMQYNWNLLLDRDGRDVTIGIKMLEGRILIRTAASPVVFIAFAYLPKNIDNDIVVIVLPCGISKAFIHFQELNLDKGC